MYTCLVYTSCILNFRPPSAPKILNHTLPLEWRGSQQEWAAQQSIANTPLSPPFPTTGLPSSPLHWHLAWTYQSCLCPRLDHSSKRKREGASLDLIWVDKFSLHHPQHFCMAGLKAHLSCWGKGAQGQGGKVRGPGCWGGTPGDPRRAEARDKDGQASAASSSGKLVLASPRRLLP